MKGAVRPAISLLFAAALVYGFIVGRVPTEAFIPLAGGAIGWWFYERGKEKKLGG